MERWKHHQEKPPLKKPEPPNTRRWFALSSHRTKPHSYHNSNGLENPNLIKRQNHLHLRHYRHHKTSCSHRVHFFHSSSFSPPPSSSSSIYFQMNIHLFLFRFLFFSFRRKEGEIPSWWLLIWPSHSFGDQIRLYNSCLQFGMAIMNNIVV